MGREAPTDRHADTGFGVADTRHFYLARSDQQLIDFSVGDLSSHNKAVLPVRDSRARTFAEKLKRFLLLPIGVLLCACSDTSQPPTPIGGAEIIELEAGKDYVIKIGDSEYSISVSDNSFSVMRREGVRDEYFSPFSVILEDGELWYDIRSTDGGNLFAVQDFDGDGLGDRRMTFPIPHQPGSIAKLEIITHQFELETDPSVRKLSSEQKSEQGSPTNTPPRP